MLFKATFVCFIALSHATLLSKQALIIKAHESVIKTQAQTVLRLSRSRALVLAAQILYLRIGKQPKPFVHRSQFFRQANIGLWAAPAELDMLIDARNAIAHPCCPHALREEAIELLGLLSPSNHVLSRQELLALRVLDSFLRSCVIKKMA